MPLAGRHELPPLTMGDLSIAADELLRGLGGAGVMTEGDFEALIRMEVTFARKKGEYYACYEFGTAITPDSDQMMRIGTLAMVRLLLRCGSFRACYSKLSEASAAALRRKVAEPSGFAGLELEDTGYETLAALVAACRADGWVLDKAALDRPLFPGVDGPKASKMSEKSVSRVCCSSAACARCRDAPLAGSVHSLGPRECTDPTGVSRLDAVLEMELQKVRRRTCHRRRPGGGGGV